jgi:TonB family protein
MSFFLDTQETSQRFSEQISEFRSLLDTNHVRHDSPDNLFEFANILESNNQLRLDLSAMVKSIVKREQDELLLTDMISIIATAVGGPSFADTNADITKPTNTLMEFLLGTGCWKQFGSSSSPISKNAAPPHEPPVRAEELRPTRVSPPTSIPIGSENTEVRAELLDTSSELRQMLSRLESNTLQVERHLDSIEQRLSRIEPLPKPLPTPAPSQPEPLLHPSSAGIVPDVIGHPCTEDIPVFEPEIPTRNRAIFSHQPQNQSQDQSQTDDLPSPTFAYGAEKGRSVIPIGIFLVLLAVIAALLFFARSEQGRTLLKAGVSRLENMRALFSSVPATAPPQPTASSSPTPPTSTVAPAATPPAPTKGTIEPTPTRSVASDNASSNISSDARPLPDSPKIRHLPASLMVGYLVSAPKPKYPPRARNDGIEGSVALEVTISKSGSIETLHVINGPQSLRSAAVDAVRYWRYKPYLVDGRPVEVLTTVNVHFTLKPPPVIVR